MNRVKVTTSRLKRQLSSVQWRWVILAGVGATAITVVFWALLMFCYAVILAALAHGAPDRDQILGLASQADWAAPMLTLVLTVVAASWAAHKANSQAVLHGVLVGVVSSLSGQAVGSIFDGAPNPWALAMFPLSVSAGWLGGLEAQSAVAGQEALYQASRALGAARTPQAIVDAIGTHLAGSQVVQVALWQTVSRGEDGTPAELELLASWTPASTKPLPPGLRFPTAQAPALTNLRREATVSLRADELPSFDRVDWAALGVRSATLLPLLAPGESWTGLLMVASRARRSFSRGTTGKYLALSAQAATALENLRLVEEGRQIGVLAERQRLAQEIHDTLAQGFTSIVMHLEAAEQALPASQETALSHIDWARGTARQSLAEARRVVWALRPEILEGASLPEAIGHLVGRWSEESAVSASAEVTGTARPLPTHTEATLLRATQEALANVRKHARARNVAVTLSYMADMVALDVRDDGAGFNSAQAPRDNGNAAGGFGLAAMRERVEQQGGKLIIESALGEGATLVVELPISQEASVSAKAANRQEVP
jgi:signal transduction histidine kinase